MTIDDFFKMFVNAEKSFKKNLNFVQNNMIFSFFVEKFKKKHENYIKKRVFSRFALNSYHELFQINCYIENQIVQIQNFCKLFQFDIDKIHFDQSHDQKFRKTLFFFRVTLTLFFSHLSLLS